MRPYLRAANVSWAGLRLDDVKSMNFTDDELKTYRLEPGDILLSEASGSAGEVGKPALWTGEIADCAFQNTLIRVRPREHEPRFLLHYFRHQALAGRFVEQSRGVGIHHLGRSRLASWPTPVPPLDEQRRIVDLLEDHLSRLDAAESNLVRAERRAGLLWATALSDLILPPGARNLLGSDPALLGDDSPPTTDLPKGWRWARWADLGTSENGKPFPSGEYQDNGIRLLRPGNLGPQGVLAWSDANTRFMPESYRFSHPRSILHSGDLVMNLTAQSLKDDFLGRACIVRDGDESLLNQRIARLRSTAVDGGFALAVFRSRLFRHYVKSLSTGSLIQHMFTSQLNRFWMPVPPAAEQQRIVIAASTLEADIARQVSVLRLQAQRSLLLRRSLLTAAFSGRLTGAAPDVTGTEVVEELAGV